MNIEDEEQPMSEFELFKFRMGMVEEIIDHFLDKYYQGHITSFCISDGMVKCQTECVWDRYDIHRNKFEFPLEWAFVKDEHDVFEENGWTKKYEKLAADHMAIVRQKENEIQQEKDKENEQKKKEEDLRKPNYLKEKYEQA